MNHEFATPMARQRHIDAIDEEQMQLIHQEQVEKQLCEVRQAIGKGDWSALVWDTHDAKKVPVTDLFARFLSEEKEGQEDTAKAIIRTIAGAHAGVWQLAHEFFGWYEKECMK